MIEINLLPGSGKKTRTRGPGIDFAGLVSGVVAKVKDPFLIGAVVSSLLAAVLVGGMYWYQHARAIALDEQVQQAEQDSVRFAAVIAQKRKAEAQRDSVLHQVTLIKSFDNKRFVWPHLMDEVSRALPPYTWLTSIAQTNLTPKTPQPAAKKGAKPAADTSTAPAVQFRIEGNTVDIQALTRFMTVLEASPFVQNVQLVKSALIVVDGKEVTNFQLDASYQVPDSSVITVVPVALSVR